MSDGGRERASLGVGVWKSSQKWSVQRVAVRSIAWLDLFAFKLGLRCIEAGSLQLFYHVKRSWLNLQESHDASCFAFMLA